ncbi:DUF438 domain-containing protein [Candidatus Xianfuyuplasma coldseepsis]|uniref:DUF438 domain-containing protein n=1 Tax=Candidatus Xianfuyuplasma coldseepsis TaxID=2782163 RepID=A0A7L7KNW2_9MOLU|nr:DUF438 domain-containing protein [Xianfuyuplasma coldseepsis]QMS84383.1 DUF438 domain-containing protein [Xianfuyuplasma coldseepsis]
MSELINNRQEQLKAIIKQIHNGLPLDQAKSIFKEQFGTVTTEEITSMEHSLIEEGMDIAEVQKLCDVHAAVFDGAISDIHKAQDITDIPGHPAQVLREENDQIQTVLEVEIKPYLDKLDKTSILMLSIGFERLSEINNHYTRKENLFFPGLEKRGVTSIPKVMWGVDNEIRLAIKNVLSQLRSTQRIDDNELQLLMKSTVSRVEDMIVKENNILLPLLSDTLSLYDWILADEGSEEIGYFLEKPSTSWKQISVKPVPEQDTNTEIQSVQFDAGELLPQELNAILNTVPFDMTFIDKDGHVKYFTQGKERIFDRPKTILGRHVNMCHPPQSVHIVDAIVNSFKDGSKDQEDFWIDFHKMFVHIRYYAIRDKNGEYLGTLEVTQDVKPIRELQGEKRLMDQ